jgi:hypothetical protein
MKRFVFAGAACGALLLGLFAGAIRSDADTTPAPTPVPRSSPDFSSMQIFMGTWTCTQMVRGKNRPDTSTTTMALDGQYMMTHDVAPPFDQYRTQPVISDSYMTYNATTHMWVTVGVDNFGGYFMSTSPGWNGNTMTTTTTMTNDGTTGSDVLTKVSDTETSDASVSKDPQGNVTRATVTCKKTG